jgi:hypothetical protein
MEFLSASVLFKKDRLIANRRSDLREGDVMLRRKPGSNDGLERTGATAMETREPEPPSVTPPDEQDIADRAYQRWVDRGCPQGSPEEDWFEAERELRSRSSS